MTISTEQPNEVAQSTMAPPVQSPHEVVQSSRVPPSKSPRTVWTQRPGWLSQHLGTALIGAALGYWLGHWFGNYISSDYYFVVNTGQNAIADTLALILGVVGWLAGIGALNYPLAKIIGKEAKEARDVEGWTRYVRLSSNHKVVGIQYVVSVLLFFFTAGLLAMAIRTELLSPTFHMFSADTYIKIVSEHGTMMMMMASSIVVGPLGNYLVPLMIGSRRMAYPRIEAFSFWLFTAGYMVIFSALPYGGFPTGWTGYAPLANQAGPGMVSYLFGFAIIGIAMAAAGFNIACTIINYRAPGMTWSRVPAFVWGILATAGLMTLATPSLFIAGYFGLLDHTVLTAFYVAEHGGSSYLWENLFWFFGHPEVYIMALPGFGIVAELLPVFARKPLFAFKVVVAGELGVAILSFFVWQHHIFQSGIDPSMRPLYMLTTELISIPTGFIFFVGMGTLYKAKIRFTVPMLFCFAFFFNFLIGGVSGVFQSDVPVNVTVHGGFFVLSHFHYTILGGLVFAFFGGLYYWLPLMTGLKINKKLSLIQFWTMFVFFNLTFFPMLIIGLLGQPRRVFTYAQGLTALNDFSSISAYCLGASFLLFAWTLAYSLIINPQKSPPNPWESLGLEWQTAKPVPVYNFERIPVIMTDPYHYSEEGAPKLADFGDGSSGGRSDSPPPSSESVLS